MPLTFEQEFLKIITPIYAVLIAIEILASHFGGKKYYTWRDTLFNVGLSSLNALIDVSFRVIYIVIFYYFLQFRWIDWQPSWVYWLALLVCQDICFYFLHYTEHRSRFFWAVHVTHHSSEKFNLTVGFRSSVFEPLYRFVFFLPLIFLGFQPADIILMYSITQVYGILIHTQFIHKLGFLEYILVTPSHHRVHHASNVPYLDKNIGMVFIFWDKLFGTFQAENAPEPTKYGLTHQIKNQHFLTVLLHEWWAIGQDVSQKNLTWRERWAYIFGRPGWSHDGSRQTTQELQAKSGTQQNSN
ncbi:MAG: sterol desaturase family protein [Microscillaceae bacterium]|jgi:sterol desaturase/sphingolipid hydroxylase (fatty acid hydroxylase superfamily)|nr:sterol desaturase family protein [Microscillaceae bacterium]